MFTGVCERVAARTVGDTLRADIGGWNLGSGGRDADVGRENLCSDGCDASPVRLNADVGKVNAGAAGRAQTSAIGARTGAERTRARILGMRTPPA
jgi:hypothetical protein